ncbi:MAG TPA: flagellar protein FlgN [Firmicutes bacterium]|nr:flagellar protein FlgN [Bacillota bacterium]
MSEAAVAELVEILGEQVQLYRTWNELAGRKEAALRQADVQTVEQLNKLEQALVIKGGGLEKRRYAVQVKLAAVWGVPVEEVTLPAVSERTDAVTAARCRATGAELQRLLEELRERNARCASIIAGALELVKRTLDNVAKGQNLVDRLV